MFMTDFNETNIESSKNIIFSTVDEIEKSYRNLSLVTTNHDGELILIAPKHWFIDSEDAMHYAMHSENLKNMADMMKNNIGKKVSDLNIIIKQYYTIDDFYNDYLYDFFRDDTEYEETNYIKQSIRDIVIGIIYEYRLVRLIENIKDNVNIYGIEGYITPDINIYNNAIVIADIPDNVRDSMMLAANKEDNNGLNIALSEIKSLPLNLENGNIGLPDDAKYIETYAIGLNPYNNATADFIYKDGESGKLLNEFKSIYKEYSLWEEE